MDAARILVSGAVQGVGLRYRVLMLAGYCQLTGYIKNLDDGTVEIECEGRKEDIDRLAMLIRDGTEPMRVDAVDVQYSKSAGRFKMFKIVPGSIEDELVEGFSTMFLQLMNSDIKQDKVIANQEKMLDGQEKTRSEIRVLASDLRDIMSNRMQKIEEDILKIKAHLQI